MDLIDYIEFDIFVLASNESYYGFSVRWIKRFIILKIWCLKIVKCNDSLFNYVNAEYGKKKNRV